NCKNSEYTKAQKLVNRHFFRFIEGINNERVKKSNYGTIRSVIFEERPHNPVRSAFRKSILPVSEKRINYSNCHPYNKCLNKLINELFIFEKMIHHKINDQNKQKPCEQKLKRYYWHGRCGNGNCNPRKINKNCNSEWMPHQLLRLTHTRNQLNDIQKHKPEKQGFCREIKSDSTKTAQIFKTEREWRDENQKD